MNVQDPYDQWAFITQYITFFTYYSSRAINQSNVSCMYLKFALMEYINILTAIQEINNDLLTRLGRRLSNTFDILTNLKVPIYTKYVIPYRSI